MKNRTHPTKGETMSEIRDGLYFLHPAGECWIGAEYRDGQCIARIEESNAATHSAAGDHFAGVVPGESDISVDRPTAEAIIRDVMGDDNSVEMVIVEQAQ